MEAGELPANWVETTLGQIVNLSPERVEPQDVPSAPYLSLEHLESHTHRILSRGRAKDVTSTKSRFKVGDVLYGRLRPNLNKVVIPDFDGVCSTDILVFRPSSAIHNRFLMRILSEHSFISYATRHAKGVNLPRVSTRALQAFAIQLPPMEEQRRIVERIDQLMSHVDTARNRVQSLVASGSDFRKALLRSAVVGELTQEWRTGAPTSTIDEAEHKAGKVSSDLPVGWSWITVDQAGSVQLGRQRAPQHHSGEDMRPYLRVANVLEDRIDITDVMTMNFSPREYELYRLEYGDILLNEGQSLDLIGRPAMFRNELVGACFTNTLLRFRASKEVRPEFALLVFRYYLHFGQFQTIAKITTNLAHLGAKRFARLPFPLPPISEQDEIIRLSKASFEKMTATESAGRAIELDAGKLKQSVLSAGLAGRLNTLDASDQPATLLVDRWRLEYLENSVLIAAKRGERRTKPKRSKMRDIVPVLIALRSADEPLRAQDLFTRCGYPLDASSEQIEGFFLDLRHALQTRTVSRSRHGDEDIFNLVQVGDNED